MGVTGLCNVAFESGVVPEDWRFAVIVSMYEGKGERTECSNYRGISILSVVKKNICRDSSRQSA